MERRSSSVTVLIYFFVLYACVSVTLAGYTKQEYLVAMRDGVKLYTVLYQPNPSPPSGPKQPSVMIRTPYGSSGLEAECIGWAEKEGFNCLAQDFRGRYKSQGSFEFWLNASTDGYDTMAWLTQQSWSNGKVFTTGVSAPGVAEYMQPISRPPWLRAQSVWVATAQLHQSFFQNGAYRHSLSDGWLTAIGEPQVIPIVKAQEADSPFWQNTTLDGKWKDVNVPAIHYSGWYDIFTQNTINSYEGYETMSSPPALGNNFLIMSPGGHCQGGEITWPNATWGMGVALEFSAALFKLVANQEENEQDDNDASPLFQDVPRLIWYVLGPGTPGSYGNFWTSAMTWPATKTMQLFLSADGSLRSSPPTTNGGSRSFIYDPSNPCPTIGGNNLLIPCGPRDQSSLETRSDVLVFTSSPLPSAIALTGHMSLTLWVSSNATDTDFTAKLTDVFPGGSPSMMVQDGIIRMRWRNSASTPELMNPGQLYQITIDLWSTSYIFNAGHSIRVDISSSNFPRFSANPNNGLPLAQNGSLVTARNTIYCDAGHQSVLSLPVVPTASLSKLNIESFRLKPKQ